MCAENLGRRVVATGGVWIRRSIMDPLTRLAPADESAGCDPPSPPRGRGLGILRIERFVNVETPDSSRVEGYAFHAARTRESGSESAEKAEPFRTVSASLRLVHGTGKALSVRQRINNLRSAFLESKGRSPMQDQARPLIWTKVKLEQLRHSQREGQGSERRSVSP